MQITSLQISVRRKVQHDQNEHSMEIGLQVSLESDEEPEEVYYSVKNRLEGQLDTWEHEIRSNDRPNIITIPEISTNQAPPLVTASELKPKTTRQKRETSKPIIQPIVESEPLEPQQNDYVCPNCGEVMMPKEGKDYYLCSKHWGYPDMIKKGIVKDRKF